MSERTKGKRRVKTHEVPQLAKINEDFKAGHLNYEQAYALVKDLRDKQALKLFGRQEKPITLAENLKLLDSYWEADYQFRDVVAPEAMRHDLIKSLGVIGSMSLYTATQAQLVTCLSKSGLPANSRRRVILRLNQLLKFARREFTLKMPKEEYLDIKYLNIAEVRQVASHVGGEDGDLILLAFATGCRLGELFGLTEKSVKPTKGRFTHLYIGSQIRKNSEKALPKNRRSRTTLMLPIGDAPLQRWLQLSTAERPKRTKLFNEVVYKACVKLWPTKTDKHVCFHDLRHSFACEMGRQGRSINEIAQMLGNSPEVCRKYYTGVGLTDENLEALDERLANSFKD